MSNESRLGRVFSKIRGIFQPEKALRNPQQESLNLVPKHLQGFLTPSEIALYIQNVPIAVARQEKLDADYLTKEKPSGWGMSDPQNHDPDNFRYLVHSINYDNDFVASMRNQPLRKFSQRAYQRDLPSFLRREVISCSVIDEKHTYTYTQDSLRCHGFIFEAPEENIVAICPDDMGKPWDIESEARARSVRWVSFKEREETPSAQQFLDNRKSYDGYNEVLVNGIGLGGAIRISGIFMIDNPILRIPIYEIYNRVSKEALQGYYEYKKKGWSEEQIMDERFYGPVLYRNEKRWTNQINKQFQEAKDLALLLQVPLVHIPQHISAQIYRKYLLTTE